MSKTAEFRMLESINEKLDILITLNLLKNEDRDTTINRLVMYGFTNKKISNLTGIPKGTVDMIRAKFNK